MRIEIQNIVVSIHKNQEREIQKEIEKAGIEKENIESIHYLRRSIDSRKKQDIKFVYTIELRLKHKISATSSARWKEVKEVSKIKRLPLYPRKEIYIVGSGPAGLFAAYRLAEYGYLPIVLERGEEIEHRDKTTEDFIKTSILNPNSNIQFGEGGAGTYSDGKLNTRVKSEYIETIFQLFVKFGAPEEILWSYKPHVGTDILKVVVKNMREAIRKKGGKFYFNTLLEDIKIKSGELQGFWMIKNGIREYVASNQLILAIGHSSRDTYRMLRKRGLAMEAKAFAMGTRMEHPREEIDRMQYGKEVKNPLLEAATYAVTYNNSMEKRGTFSFCMCPGGVIVNAASQAGGSLVNGMSYSTRNGKFSNSAIVVGIKEHEFGEDLFSGMYFQESLEKKAYEMIGNYGAIYQNVWDFLDNRKTEHEIESSYRMQKISCRMEELFPDVISQNLRAALSYWKKNPDFISRNVNLIAPETRTSAPLKILRDIRGESLNVKGLYPIGEGAGYAGGITSAAVDGMKIVDCAFTRML
ncbi:hypothetical protein IX329_000045 [Fusobacterium necrophorum]|nr:hypothetical protein [Fusobacterium necrophorum]MBR8788651.1 hypothetical protein [Fusobacterium necrophorum]